MLNPGPALLRRHVRNKDDPLVEKVELLEANPSYAYIKFDSGRETTVSLRDLAPYPVSDSPENLSASHPVSLSVPPRNANSPQSLAETSESLQPVETFEGEPDRTTPKTGEESAAGSSRPLRATRPPERYGEWITVVRNKKKGKM